MSWNIFITRQIPDAGIEILKKACHTVDVFGKDRVMTHEELIKEVEGRDAILCLLNDTINDEIIEAANQTEVISNYAVGYNNINVATATQNGIMVTNTPGVLTNATADLAWALLLAAARRIPESDRYVRDGNFTSWGPKLLRGVELSGKTLGIIGAGRIGHAVAKRAIGFDMKLVYNSRNKKPGMRTMGAKYMDLKNLLKQSDIISLNLPLTDETRHLISTEELASMKSGSILINTARGPIIDEKALIYALKNGPLGAAALDVFENEPRVEAELMTLDNVVMTPHTGSSTYDARDKMAIIAAENILAALRGDIPEYLVNPEVMDL
ncbi:D-glycerate dehydrogenase [bacterium]|nr:D-glycerate dehydrogenase [bacterium]